MRLYLQHAARAEGAISMNRALRIATISGHGAALAAALVRMTGRTVQEIEVVEIVVKEPEPLPQLQFLANPVRQPVGHGPQRTRKGKPVRW